MSKTFLVNNPTAWKGLEEILQERIDKAKEKAATAESEVEVRKAQGAVKELRYLLGSRDRIKAEEQK